MHRLNIYKGSQPLSSLFKRFNSNATKIFIYKRWQLASLTPPPRFFVEEGGEPTLSEIDTMQANSVIGYRRQNYLHLHPDDSHALIFKLPSKGRLAVNVNKKYVMPVKKTLESGQAELGYYLDMLTLAVRQQIKLLNVCHGPSALPRNTYYSANNESFYADANIRNMLEDISQFYLRHQMLDQTMLANAIGGISAQIADHIDLHGYRGNGDLEEADKDCKYFNSYSLIDYLTVALTLKARLEYISEDPTRVAAFAVKVEAASNAKINSVTYKDLAKYNEACQKIKENTPDIIQYAKDEIMNCLQARKRI